MFKVKEPIEFIGQLAKTYGRQIGTLFSTMKDATPDQREEISLIAPTKYAQESLKKRWLLLVPILSLYCLSLAYKFAMTADYLNAGGLISVAVLIIYAALQYVVETNKVSAFMWGYLCNISMTRSVYAEIDKVLSDIEPIDEVLTCSDVERLIVYRSSDL